jgi:hypothetical protein
VLLFGRNKAGTTPPKEFIRAIDDWSLAGGPLPDLVNDHKIRVAAEAEAVCRALCSKHILSAEPGERSALYHLAVLFQQVETKEGAEILASRGLPHLRAVLRDVLDNTVESAASRQGCEVNYNDYMFVLKILAMYGESGDGSLMVRAARDPRMAAGDLWYIIFDLVDRDHPDASAIWEALREPLPEGVAGIHYLDIANRLVRERKMARHPFDTEAGISRLFALLADRLPDDYVYAQCAVACIPFVNAEARQSLFESADRHPDGGVRLEGARALASTGSEFGWHRLAQLCLNLRFASDAIEYLEELGLGEHVPKKAREPDFRALAEMCKWLADPMEYGRHPDEITLYDTRELNWPPTDDCRRLWLFKYRFEPEDDDDKAKQGVGMVGSTTFALFGEAAPELPPEDIYGLHCCWELEIQEDSRAPAKRSAAAGRRMLAKVNKDFSAR